MAFKRKNHPLSAKGGNVTPGSSLVIGGVPIVMIIQFITILGVTPNFQSEFRKKSVLTLLLEIVIWWFLGSEDPESSRIGSFKMLQNCFGKHPSNLSQLFIQV